MSHPSWLLRSTERCPSSATIYCGCSRTLVFGDCHILSSLTCFFWLWVIVALNAFCAWVVAAAVSHYKGISKTDGCCMNEHAEEWGTRSSGSWSQPLAVLRARPTHTSWCHFAALLTSSEFQPLWFPNKLRSVTVIWGSEPSKHATLPSPDLFSTGNAGDDKLFSWISSCTLCRRISLRMASGHLNDCFVASGLFNSSEFSWQAVTTNICLWNLRPMA